MTSAISKAWSYLVEKVKGWMGKGKGWGKGGKPDKGDEPAPEPTILERTASILSTGIANMAFTLTTRYNPPTGGVGPTIDSTSPVDGFIGHFPDDPITITFNKNIQAGTGNILMRVADEGGTFSTQDTIVMGTDVGTGPGQYTISGSTLTIYPDTQTPMRRYAIQIAATAIDGTDATSFAGILDDTTYDFITGTGVTVPTIAGNTYTNTVTSQTNPTIASDTKYVSCTFSSQANISGSESTWLQDIGFDGCFFTSSSGNGAQVRWAQDILFEDCTFSSNGLAGMKMSSTGSTLRVTMSGCDITNSGENGISSGKRSQNTPQIDHVDTIIHNCTINNTGSTGTIGSMHGIYLQGTDFTIQNTTLTGSNDGNGMSLRTAGTVFNCTVDCTSANDSTGSGIKYFGDHLAGPLTTPRTNDPYFIAFNTVDGNSSLWSGIEITFASNSSGSPYTYTDAEWYINNARVYGNSVSNCTNSSYAYRNWGTPTYLDIYQDGVLQW